MYHDLQMQAVGVTKTDSWICQISLIVHTDIQWCAKMWVPLVKKSEQKQT